MKVSDEGLCAKIEGAKGTYPGATQFTMTPLEVMGDRWAICFTTKIANNFETL